MNPEYSEIFGKRGHSYHSAMTKFPQARAEEFSGLFARFPLVSRERILDIPAGGGYLSRALGERALVTSLEIASEFGSDIPVIDSNALDLPSGFDRAVCLAALHHIAEPVHFLMQVRAALSAGGILHVADIAAGSPICEFLDGFVARYNVTGHVGRYLPEDPAYFGAVGAVAHCQQLPCPWHFVDEEEMLRFCSELFGLVDCPSAELREALCDLVGIRQILGGVALDWRLLYVDIVV